MHKPAHVIEIFLQPGEVYFGDRDTRIRTLLGSCVSMTVWHPQKLIGGMCHYILPTRSKRPCGELDGKYADEAMELLLSEICAANTKPSEYVVKLFGAGNMFPLASHQDCQSCTLETAYRRPDGVCPKVSCRNRQVAYYLAEKHGFLLSTEHLGGTGYRNIFFDIWNGNVWVRHQPSAYGKDTAADNNKKRVSWPQ